MRLLRENSGLMQAGPGMTVMHPHQLAQQGMFQGPGVAMPMGHAGPQCSKGFVLGGLAKP